MESQVPTEDSFMMWFLSNERFGRIDLVLAAVLLAMGLCLPVRAVAAGPATLVKDGRPAMTILVDGAILPVDQAPAVRQKNQPIDEKREALDEQRRAALELQKYVKKMSGAELKVEAANAGATGCYVGLDSSFPWLKQDLKTSGLEGFIIQSEPKNLLLLAHEPLGVRHAVNTFLMDQGCRWFFAGQAWEVVPKKPTVA